ncbi:hypothetical protein ACNKHQ_16570 [Shigella flexneri]
MKTAFARTTKSKPTAALTTTTALIICAHTLREMMKAVTYDGVDLMGYTPWGWYRLRGVHHRPVQIVLWLSSNPHVNNTTTAR